MKSLLLILTTIFIVVSCHSVCAFIFGEIIAFIMLVIAFIVFSYALVISEKSGENN